MSDKIKVSPIQEYFDNVNDNNSSQLREALFDFTDENIKGKTELTNDEILIFAKMFYIDKYMFSIGLKPMFDDFRKEIMKLKVSKDRQSRKEFVQANRNEEEIPENKSMFQMLKNFGR